ncbi:hypothetical protein JYG23_04280 [Sedimentibacter sp. zth1]|uniref:hypothetical protein n=1 Tax=Sedimentibacter sp. zth1 TaxID=2816908 RepID=UPI001A92CDAC|nr:hypothetical protein [Sedimentibacter sp. zth1]QSX05918.1 hypothetical protein JYG23_00145 [Sedimentibacter sp. zth1]QSX06679.1 hypothetical protein JYG23_04280 [Sedimentibacter sp. zth1]
MGNIELKWNRISQKSKGRYMFVEFSLKKVLSVQLILLIVLELIFNYRNEDIKLFVIQSIIKLTAAYILGVVIGKLEWEYIKKLNERKFFDKKVIRRNYIIIYGILFFGLNSIIATISPFFVSTKKNLTEIVSWLLVAWIWGLLMWITSGSELEKYIK